MIATQAGFVVGARRCGASAWFDPSALSRGLGNGRFIRNVFEEAVSIQAQRLVRLDSPSAGQIQTLLPEDLPCEPPTDDDRSPGMYL